MALLWRKLQQEAWEINAMPSHGYESGRLNLPFVGIFTFAKGDYVSDWTAIDDQDPIHFDPRRTGPDEPDRSYFAQSSGGMT